MLRDAIECVVEQTGFQALVADAGAHPEGGCALLVSANDPAALTAYLLRYQREIHELTLDEVAAKLGVTSRNAYARYEQGRSEPSLGKLIELLAVVAPELAMIVGPRAAPKQSRTKRGASKRTVRRSA